MISAGEIALQLQDQGWRGLLPLLPHDATAHIRLAPDKAAEVASGRGKAPGRWARAGWSLLPDWRTYPDDAETVEEWASWPDVNVGQRAVVAGIHPKTGRPYFWPEGGLEETEPTKLPPVTPAELYEILGACSKI